MTESKIAGVKMTAWSLTYSPVRKVAKQLLIHPLPNCTAKHHSSQNPQDVSLQRSIQHHRNAIHTLKKDLSLDDADTLTFHRDKHSKRRKMPSTSYEKLKNKINYFPPSRRTLPTMWDPLTTYTTLCGTTLRNTKITTPPPHCPRRHGLMHLPTSESG